MGMLDLVLKMSSEWQEEWGCAQQSIARLGFTATGDCCDAELRRSEKNAWAFIKVVDISRVTSLEIIKQKEYKPELFRGHAK